MPFTTSPDRLLPLSAIYGLPLYVYDSGIIDRQISILQEAFGYADMRIHYACKALSTIEILRHIHSRGCGINTVSPGEILTALYAGIPESKITFTPSGVDESEYEFALARNIHVHVDQLHILEWIDRHFPGTAITLRFNPGIQAGGHTKLQVGSENSKFGFATHQVDEVKKMTDRLSLRITGVHMHLGSDIGDTASFDQAYEYLLSMALRWQDTIETVDLGGGYKVPYHPEDPAIDISAFGKKVSGRFEDFCTSVGRPVTMVLEPGKFLVSAAGFLLVEVTGVRKGKGTDLAYVSSGFNHFLRPMSYGAYHHVINLSNPHAEPRHYNLVGYLCETDTFAGNRPISEIRKGDILCLMNTGAYGYSMASNYNSRPRPAEVMLYPDNTHKLIRRAETIEDIIQTDLGISY